MMLPRHPTRVTCMTLVLILASCGLASAQQGGTDPAVERISARLRSGNQVTVTLEDGATLKGRFMDVRDGALGIARRRGNAGSLPRR